VVASNDRRVRLGVFNHRSWRDVFVTHTHLDHLLLKEYVSGAKLRFYTSKEYFDEVVRRYGDVFEVTEYTDVVKTVHTSLTGRKFERVETTCFFVEECLVIPESDEPQRLIEEYAPKFAFVFVAFQSHFHPVDFDNSRKDVFIVDNRVWKPYAPNVVPKIAFSCSKSDRKLYEQYFKKL